MKKSRKKLFRDFSYRKQRYVINNELKRLRSTVIDFEDKYDVFGKEIMFMLWANDLEFWTLDFAAIYKYFDKMTPSQTLEDHLFREETKYNYRVRYALTKKARMMLRAFYKKLGFDFTQ